MKKCCEYCKYIKTCRGFRSIEDYVDKLYYVSKQIQDSRGFIYHYCGICDETAFIDRWENEKDIDCFIFKQALDRKSKYFTNRGIDDWSLKNK
jgi:hypothetical protein